MAKFYGEVAGSARSKASRIGHQTIWSHVRGWRGGIEVNGGKYQDREFFDVYITGGSNRASRTKLVGTLSERPDGIFEWSAVEQDCTNE